MLAKFLLELKNGKNFKYWQIFLNNTNLANIYEDGATKFYLKIYYSID